MTHSNIKNKCCWHASVLMKKMCERCTAIFPHSLHCMLLWTSLQLNYFDQFRIENLIWMPNFCWVLVSAAVWVTALKSPAICSVLCIQRVNTHIRIHKHQQTSCLKLAQSCLNVWTARLMKRSFYCVTAVRCTRSNRGFVQL